MDLKSDFIHGDLQEEIYMKQPEDYTSDPSLVCKLQKSLYGLKHAPRSWYAKMDAFLLSQKFQRCKSDPNVYLQQYDGNIINILLYVYDILITGSTLASIAFIKTALHDAFKMSDLGMLRQFLGMEITQDYDGIMVTQSKYFSCLLISFNMADCKDAPFPFLSGISLEEGKSTTPMDSTIYRQLIKSFLYLTNSRPEFVMP